jgi:glycosyltransferase involved in cell wall biosynthesis
MKILNNPKISIGMPVLNGEKHIGYALDSIFKQTFKNFNLIIYDNASTDKTLSICEKYKKKYNNIKIYKQKKRVDGIKNWISVLKKTNRKYFLFCAHDDVFKEKEYLKNLINKIDDNKIPFGTVNIINKKNHFVHHICNNKIYNYSGPKIYRRLKFFTTPSILGKNNIIYGIHERKHILRILKFFNKKKYIYNDARYKYLDKYPDNYQNYKILKEKEIVHVTKTTLLKRIRDHEVNISFFGIKKNKFKILLDHFLILLKYIRFSNFLEIIIIIIISPICIFYERISLLIFKINNKFNFFDKRNKNTINDNKSSIKRNIR